MNFGYDENGKLVPIESIRLADVTAELEAKLDARPLSLRIEDSARIRALLLADGGILSLQDRDVLLLYEEGVLDFHNVELHFGKRLTEAFLKQEGGPDGAA